MHVHVHEYVHEYVTRVPRPFLGTTPVGEGRDACSEGPMGSCGERANRGTTICVRQAAYSEIRSSSGSTARWMAMRILTMWQML